MRVFRLEMGIVQVEPYVVGLVALVPGHVNVVPLSANLDLVPCVSFVLSLAEHHYALQPHAVAQHLERARNPLAHTLLAHECPERRVLQIAGRLFVDDSVSKNRVAVVFLLDVLVSCVVVETIASQLVFELLVHAFHLNDRQRCERYLHGTVIYEAHRKRLYEPQLRIIHAHELAKAITFFPVHSLVVSDKHLHTETDCVRDDSVH